MPTPEFELWREYHKRHGFTVDRIVWAVAIAGAAINNALGGKRRPADNIPRFWRPADLANKELIAALSALPGAKVRKRPRKERDG